MCQLLPSLKSSSLDAFEPPWSVLQILERIWFLGLGSFPCVFGFGFSGKEMNILEEPNIIPIHYWLPKLNSIQLFKKKLQDCIHWRCGTMSKVERYFKWHGRMVARYEFNLYLYLYRCLYYFKWHDWKKVAKWFTLKSLPSDISLASTFRHPYIYTLIYLYLQAPLYCDDHLCLPNLLCWSRPVCFQVWILANWYFWSHSSSCLTIISFLKIIVFSSGRKQRWLHFGFQR